MKKALATSALLIIAACGGGSGSAPPVSPPPPPTPVDAVQDFSDSIQDLTLEAFYFESFKGLTVRSPETVVQLALESVFPLAGVTLDDLFDEYQRTTFELYQITLDKLHTYDRAGLSADGQLEYDIYEWYLQDAVDRLEFIYYDFPATYSLFGVPRSTQIFFTDLHPLETRQDALNYLARLSVLDMKFAQLEAHLLRQRDAGIVEPILSLQVAINQVAQIASTPPTDQPYVTAFRDRIQRIADLSDVDRADFHDRAVNRMSLDVIPAYERLLNTLRSLIADAPAAIGVGQYPQGAEYYANRLRHHTTTELSAADIHQLGLNELARIHAEMRVIFNQLGYPQNESLQELYGRVEADGGIVAAADSLTTFENLVAFAESSLNQAFDIAPLADIVVLPDPFGGFYIGPSFDGTRPGAFYAGTDFDQPYYPMPSLTFHEALPGHHLQIAIAMEADAPAFRKGVRFTGFVEGWALYAERVAYELGWYDNDVYGNLGRLQFEALRAARLVMDTGIHSLGWSFDAAAQFNEDNVGWTNAQSQGAAARYSVWPGQATAYMVGMLSILSERQRAMDILGQDFDLIAFHRALLTAGAVPLTLLDDVVDRYIAEIQAAE